MIHVLVDLVLVNRWYLVLWSDQIYPLPLDWFTIGKCLSFDLNKFGDIS